MKRMLISRLAIGILALAVLVVMPLPQAKANNDNCFFAPNGYKCCPGDFSPVCRLVLNEQREKQRLLAAYTAQRKPPTSPNSPRQALTLRSAATIGLSVFMLLGGLLVLAKFILAFLAALR